MCVVWPRGMQRVQWTGEENEAECRKWRPTPALLTPFGYPTLISRPTVRTRVPRRRRREDGGLHAAVGQHWGAWREGTVVGDHDGNRRGMRFWSAVRRALYAVRRTDGGGVTGPAAKECSRGQSRRFADATRGRRDLCAGPLRRGGGGRRCRTLLQATAQAVTRFPVRQRESRPRQRPPGGRRRTGGDGGVARVARSERQGV